jgi:hypothetical protein
MPKPLLASILALMSLSLVAMPLASYAAPVDRAASTNDAPAATATDRSDDDDDSPERETSKRSAAQMFAQAESAREVRALRQLGVKFQQPCAEAKAAAEDDVNGTLWIAGGCLANVGALGYATFVEPDPPSSPLVGKDEQYVAEYTDCYQEAAVDKRQNNALYGCIGSGLAYIGLYAVAIAGASASTTTY